MSADHPVNQPDSSSKIIDILKGHSDNLHEKFASHNMRVFCSGPLEINGSPEEVWPLVLQAENYFQLSAGAIKAEVHGGGPIEEGKNITMKLYKDSWKGMIFPSSTENITLVDHEQKLVGWVRHLPFKGGKTERYQILLRTEENKTKSIIALNIPGFTGFFVNLFFKNTIKTAFKSLNEGMKKEIEKTLDLKRK